MYSVPTMYIQEKEVYIVDYTTIYTVFVMIAIVDNKVLNLVEL
jgi:hypothetical protein